MERSVNTSAQTLAEILKVSVNHLTPYSERAMFMDMCRIAGADMEVTWYLDDGLMEWDQAMLMKAAIMSRFNRISEVRAFAASRGFVLPEDPRPRLQELNANRGPWVPLLDLGIPQAELTALAEAAVALSKVAKAYDEGAVKFDRAQPATQLACFEVSVDGMTPQSGDALVDILGYQPDADFVKRKRALDSLTKLDFSKRKPYLLFVADVVRDGRRSEGTIVCWGKMRDASGYRIHKRDVFAMIDFPEMAVSNDWLRDRLAELMRTDSFVQTLSFYDWLTPDDVCAFIDPQVVPNTLFSYEIQGLQTRAPATPFLFDVPTSALYLTPAQLEQLYSLVGQETAELDSVSPYPALSKLVYGDPGFGWVLAGCNVLNSQRRGDSADQTRSLSYVGSKLSVIAAEATAGRLVAPVDLTSVQRSVDVGVSAYGISQTLLCVFDGVGLTLFISGKDELTGFQSTAEAVERAGGGLAKILAAIDPESATLDPSVLAASVTRDPSQASRYEANQVQQSGAARNPPFDTQPIDLTTYAGINRLMGLIRTIYDFFPGVLA
jgi:hypothetical protein